MFVYDGAEIWKETCKSKLLDSLKQPIIISKLVTSDN